MKKNFFAALLSFVSLHTMSQQQPQNSTEFSILIGPSFPAGKYAHTSDFWKNLGPATTGEFLKLLLSHTVTNTFRISAQLQFQRNALNTSSMKADLNNGSFYSQSVIFVTTYPPPSPPPPPRPMPHRNWTVNKSSWYVASLMVGGSAHFPFSDDNKWSVFVGTQLGAAYTSTPKIDAQSITDTLQIAVHQDSRSSFGFAYILNCGLSFQLNKKTSVVLHCDYFATHVKYDNVKTNAVGLQPGSLNPVSISQVSRDISQSISSVNVGIGVAFHF